MKSSPAATSPAPSRVIAPHQGWRLVDWRELVEYRDLFFFLVWRDIKALYKQSVLGFGWALVQPLVTMVLFTVIFGRLAGVPTDGVPQPLFYLSGLIPWTYASNAIVGATNSLITQSNLLSKVYVPRLILPATPVLAKLVDLAIASSAMVVMMAVYHWTVPGFSLSLSGRLLILPYLLLLAIITAAGIGIWLASLAVQYRDVRFATPFLMQLLMYAAPVVWPASLLPTQWRMIAGLYPLFGIIEGFRAAVLPTGPMPWDLIASGTVGAGVTFITGVLFFRRQERWFADVV